MNIRNFCIVAHIDHGKSTLADRFLEITGTVEKRRMRAQYLDQLESERERGITIKMAPVRMSYTLNAERYTLNLIDTPGHSDFSYEVSRALAAVEGAILLVDASQGIQAQTISNFHAAQKAGLTIIGAVNKIDLNLPGIGEVIKSVADLLGVSESEIFRVSAKTSEGVPELLGAVIGKVPLPSQKGGDAGGLAARALIFDSFYHEHKGIVAAVRVFDGEFIQDSVVHLVATNTDFKIKELGYFAPELKGAEKLGTGEIGYIATGLKNPELLKIGDTICAQKDTSECEALAGYQEPQPVVFVSFYPESADDYENLKSALGKLRLNDSALKFEPDFNEFLGRGFKTGFLGKLHFEITAERLEKEFHMKTVHSFPSVAYRVRVRGEEWTTVKTPKEFPAEYLEVKEPTAKLEILVPPQYLGAVLQLQTVFRLRNIETKTVGQNVAVFTILPLADLIRDFDDQLKSVSAGYASLSYALSEYQPAKVARLDILIAGREVAGLTRILHQEEVEREARKTVEKLKNLLPRQQFMQALQVVANGRIIARENIPALKKDVTGYLYGGDRTRKMKLWKKQQRGKEKLKELASQSKINVPANVFRELLKK